MSDYEKCISSDSESEDGPLMPEPRLQKPKRQYNRKPMSDEAKEAFKERMSKARAAKKEGLPVKEIKVPKEKKVKAPKEIVKELADEVPKEPTIINNHYYNEAPKKKEVKKKNQ